MFQFIFEQDTYRNIKSIHNMAIVSIFFDASTFQSVKEIRENMGKIKSNLNVIYYDNFMQKDLLLDLSQDKLLENTLKKVKCAFPKY